MTPLELKPNHHNMNSAAILEQRRQARTVKLRADVALVELHHQAVDALLDPIAGQQVREQALAKIDKWESKHLCNPHYVESWRGILKLPLISMRTAIMRDDVEGISLRQNSPFGFLLNCIA
jgi:hypothetical protein